MKTDRRGEDLINRSGNRVKSSGVTKSLLSFDRYTVNSMSKHNLISRNLELESSAATLNLTARKGSYSRGTVSAFKFY